MSYDLWMLYGMDETQLDEPLGMDRVVLTIFSWFGLPNDVRCCWTDDSERVRKITTNSSSDLTDLGR